ncbi:YwqJ-related putative deaminase [Catenovulum sediminis]|uniref:YwqJ-related putative deaminase n=1 Tax=Catenovulum sediminis TaxID=1740262 RepID=UPI00117E7E4A|nr:YwqJ-related putative deaminase [Catenovulum sediminis]
MNEVVYVQGNSKNIKQFYNNSSGQISSSIHKILSGTDSGKVTFDHAFYANGQYLGSKNSTFIPSIHPEQTRNIDKYTISGGETLQNIAQMIYGDSSLWYLIAHENGLSKAPLDAFSASDAGTQLRLPQINTTIKNSSDNFKPYNPAEVIGDVSPSPVPPPPPKCNAIAGIVMVVVAVVVTVFTAGAGAFAVGGFYGAMSAGAGVLAGGFSTAAFAAGVVGSLASQAVGKMMGVVDDISLKDAFVSGATTWATAGLAKGLGVGKDAVSKSDWFVKQSANGKGIFNGYGIAAQAAGSYGANYAANKLVGNNNVSFSWKGMAAQVAGSVAGHGVSNNVDVGNGLVNGGISGFAAGATTAKLDHQWNGGQNANYAQVALNAFGNALGNSIVERMKSQPISPKLANVTVPEGATAAETLAIYEKEGVIDDLSDDQYHELAVAANKEEGISTGSTANGNSNRVGRVTVNGESFGNGGFDISRKGLKELYQGGMLDTVGNVAGGMYDSEIRDIMGRDDFGSFSRELNYELDNAFGLNELADAMGFASVSNISGVFYKAAKAGIKEISPELQAVYNRSRATIRAQNLRNGGASPFVRDVMRGADELIKSKDLKTLNQLQAYAKARGPNGVISEGFTNLPASVKDFEIKGLINRFGENKSQFSIPDPNAYLDALDEAYGTKSPLNTAMRARILEYIGEPGAKVFAQHRNGLPGYHAEVRAANDLLNKLPANTPASQMNIATAKLVRGTGNHFPACLNCGGILDDFNILTSIRKQ